MKTSVEIPDSLLDAARKAAAREGTTVKALIERGLRELLAKRKDGHEFRLRKASYKGKGLQPGAKALGWENLRELAYEGRGA
ncbi:MAG: type II toxin-antitoxin system VapB family antitoxin [Gammaproteobacteria bacterium]